MTFSLFFRFLELRRASGRTDSEGALEILYRDSVPNSTRFSSVQLSEKRLRAEKNTRAHRGIKSLAVRPESRVERAPWKLGTFEN